MVKEEELIALGYPEFWDTRYAADQKSAEDGTQQPLDSFEWFRNFDSLRPFFEKHLPASPSQCHILHLGCGNSVSCDLCEKLICVQS